uniref:Uncharacterized protein n=2 Tax=Rhodnius prolixus TaxID=13249 RepID=T1IF94_RHOPR
MATKKTRKRKKRPDIHLKDYVEEREVLLEYMKLNELRRFCKKLHKTAELLERDNDVYQIEKEKLLAYWNILDKQLWELVDEKRTIETRKIEKSVHDQFSLSTQKKDLMTYNFLKAKKSYNFIITRMVNRNIIFHKLQNRHKELMYQLHQARKSYITPKFEDYRSDMYQYKVSFENSVALYEKLFDVFYSLQGQYFSNRFSINKDIYKKHDSIVGRLLKRKYNLVNTSIKRLNRHRDSMSRLSSIVHRRNEANTILLKNRLERTKAVYV